jgi:hypothetical protein
MSPRLLTNRPLRTGLRLLAATLLSLAALPLLAFEIYGPRWQEPWHFTVDSNCPQRIREQILARSELFSDLMPLTYLGTAQDPANPAYNQNNHFYCSADFNESLQSLPEGVRYLSTELTSMQGNTVMGRAHLWWEDEEIIEVDIQLDPALEGWMLDDVIDHEILHGLGCDHSTEAAALLFPGIFYNKGIHYDDLQCLHSLYGLEHSLLDYRGNLFIPDARIVGKPGSWWGIFKDGEIIASGENQQNAAP